MIRKTIEGVSQKIELFDSSSRTKWIVLCAFNIYLVFTVALNSFWLDEAHVALMVRETHSLPGFIAALRFEGAPWFWHLLVYAAYRVVGDAYTAMLFVHLLTWILLSYLICYGLRLGALAAAIILLSSASYEYMLNLRQYPFAILCLLGFAAIVIRWPRAVAAPLALMALAQTSVNAFFVSVSLFISLIAYFWNDRPLRRRNAALFVVTVVLTVLQLIPDPHIIIGLRTWQFIGQIEAEDFVPQFLADISLFPTPAGFLLFFTAILGFVVLLRAGAKKELVLLILPLVLSLGGFLFIVVFKYLTLSRHHYLLPFLLVALLVIGATRANIPSASAHLFRLLAVLTLAFSFFVPFTRAIKLMLRPKTQTENVAAYLRANDASPVLLLYHETDCEGAMFYLRHKYRYYSLDRHAFIDRIIWDNEAVDNPIVRGVFRSSDFAKLSVMLDHLSPELVAQNPYLLVTAANLKNGGLADPYNFQTSRCTAAIQRIFISQENESFLVYKILPLLQPAP